MSSRVPTISELNDRSKRIKKDGGSYALSLSTRGFAMPLYAKVLDLFSNNDICSFTRKDFAKKYDLSYKGISPKHIKIPKDCTKEEIEIFYGLIVNKKGHHHTKCSNLELIVKVERLWMIVHQKPYVLASKIITLGMATGIVYEMKGK